MDDLLGPAGEPLNAAPQVPCQHKERDCREEMGGGAEVGWWPDLQEQIQNVEKPEAGWHGCREHQTACREVLSAEDGARSYWPVPALGESAPYRAVLVVSAPQADERTPFEGVPEVEEAAEGVVEGGVERDREREGKVEGS